MAVLRHVRRIAAKQELSSKTAVHNARLVEFWQAGLNCAAVVGRVAVGIVVTVLNPLTDIPGHVVKAELIRAEAPDRTRVCVLVIATHSPGCGVPTFPR